MMVIDEKTFPHYHVIFWEIEPVKDQLSLIELLDFIYLFM